MRDLRFEETGSPLSSRFKGRTQSSPLVSRLSYLFAALLLTGCHSTPPPVPLDQLNAQQTHGHQVFEVHCAACHYDRETGPLHGPSLLGLYKKPYLPSGAPANDDRVTTTIVNGRNMMPATPDFDSSDVQDLVAYLHTL
jgi:mono/diheme cytochrome c family protein